MRLRLLIAAAMTLVATCSAAGLPFAPGTPQALAGDAPACSSGGDAQEAGNDQGSGGGEDAPPKFSKAFYRKKFTMDASTDGFTSPELPVSIEGVCQMPRRYKKQAAQLEGTDGVAVVTSATHVWKDKQLLSGADGAVELDGADTARLRVRLLQPKQWREDEDGDKIPTFLALRIEITD